MAVLLIGLLIVLIMLLFWTDFVKIIRLLLMLIFGTIVVALSWYFFKKGK